MDIPQAFEEIAVFNHSKKCFLCSGDFQRRSYIFCAAVVNEKASRPFKNRTAVTKEERPRQRKNCAAIVKDKAARLRGANDNFLITVRLFGSFVPLVTVLFVAKGADTMPKRRANGEGNIRKRKDGRWEGRYTVGHDPETGKAIIKNVLSKTQAGDSVKGELIYNQARKSGQKIVRTFLVYSKVAVELFKVLWYHYEH